MATTLPANTYTLVDGSFTLGDGEDNLGEDFIGGNDTFLGKANLPTGDYTAVGETWVMEANAQGGNDRFVGGAKVGVAADGFDDLMYGWGGEDGGAVFIGDAVWMYDESAGGNDTMTGGLNSPSVFFGDGEDMYDQSSGGKDNLKGGHATTSGTTDAMASSLLVGDAWYAWGEDDGDGGVTGGNDTLTGGNATTTATGGTAGGAWNLNALFGDFRDISNDAVAGGNDSLVGGNASARSGTAMVANWLVGDGEDLYGSGGNDNIRAGGGTLSGNGEAYAFNLVSGDSMWMGDGSAAGNDTITGGGFADGSTTTGGDGYTLNLIAGDAWDTGWLGEDGADMGNDKLTGGSATSGTDGYVTNIMYGDVGDEYLADEFMYMFSGGEDEIPQFDLLVEEETGSPGADYGNDSITGGTGRAENYMVGDAEYLGADGYAETGGNDTITGGGAGSYNAMYGDSWYMGADGTGGNDRLISAAGEDYMVGDADEMDELAVGGADTFVFRFGNGNDAIGDFRLEDGDKIDISAMRTIIGSFAKLEAQGRIMDDGEGNTLLLLGRYSPTTANDTVVLFGVAPEDVTAAFFIF
jgi:hypothetical protein